MSVSSNKSYTPTQNRLANFVRHAVAMIWPVTCPVCDKKLNFNESPLCLKCLASLPRIRTDQTINHVGAPDNKVNIRSWLVYEHENPAYYLIHHIKYHDRRNLARKLGREFAAQKLVDSNIDLILPIPIHWTKFVKRSYNQTMEIARGVNDLTDIPIGNNLFAPRPHSSQTKRDRQQRFENVQNIFRIRNPHQLNDRHIAILDDVITTGATMFSALDQILSQSKPASITFLSIARTKQI